MCGRITDEENPIPSRSPRKAPPRLMQRDHRSLILEPFVPPFLDEIVENGPRSTRCLGDQAKHTGSIRVGHNPEEVLRPGTFKPDLGHVWIIALGEPHCGLHNRNGALGGSREGSCDLAVHASGTH